MIIDAIKHRCPCSGVVNSERRQQIIAEGIESVLAGEDPCCCLVAVASGREEAFDVMAGGSRYKKMGCLLVNPKSFPPDSRLHQEFGIELPSGDVCVAPHPASSRMASISPDPAGCVTVEQIRANRRRDMLANPVKSRESILSRISALFGGLPPTVQAFCCVVILYALAGFGLFLMGVIK